MSKGTPILHCEDCTYGDREIDSRCARCIAGTKNGFKKKKGKEKGKYVHEWETKTGVKARIEG